MVDVSRLSQALSLMQQALELIDEADVAAHVGAHLDLAICRLQDEVVSIKAPAPVAWEVRAQA